MIYLDNGATSFPKPPQVSEAVKWALAHCTNPGRSGHEPARQADRIVYRCRQTAAEMFGCQPEQVVFTANCTQGLNMAIHTLIKPGDTVVISGFEHNAVIRPLVARGVKLRIAGRRLFDPQDTLEQFEEALKQRPSAAVFTHCSNVFGYILPIEEMAELCKKYAVPFIVDAAQSAGHLPIHLENLGADFIAMPGHKGLLGPQGTGMLLCGKALKPLLQGGTGSTSKSPYMPEELPDAGEAGTLNVPGIAGLEAGMNWLTEKGIRKIHLEEKQAARYCAEKLEKLGYRVFYGENQSGTVSFVGKMDCELFAEELSQKGIAVRAGLHCAPLAHESVGTLDTGTVRISFGPFAPMRQARRFVEIINRIPV